MASKLRKLLLAVVSVFLCMGFRVYPGIKGWELNAATTPGRKVFVTIPTSGKTLTNNLPTSDALSSSGSTLTESQLVTSVMNDYNSIQSSVLMLVADNDSDFAAYSNNHRIIIEEGSASGVSSGEAQPKFSGSYITSCNITLTSKAYENALSYVRLVTHEIGHCIGLEHPQETADAIMSYFYRDDIYRLAIDDKMGIVHLYPKDSADGQEKATLGLSCALQP